MEEKERIRLERNLYWIGLCLPCVLIVSAMVYFMVAEKVTHGGMASCTFYQLFRIYCPGCGGTRAVIHLLHGRLLRSFLYHPLVLYTAVVYLWFMISHTIEKISHHRIRIGLHYRNGYLWIALAILVINIAVKDIALTAFHVDLLQILDHM